MVALIVVGKFVIRTRRGLALRLALLDAPLLVGVGLTQIGEFSFVLVQVARDAGHVGADDLQRHPGRLAAHHPDQRGARAYVPGWIGRAPRTSRRGAASRGRRAGGARSTSCSAASAASAAPSARRSRPSASGTSSSSAIRTSCTGLRSRAGAVPLRRRRRPRPSSRRPACAGPRSWSSRYPRSIGRTWWCATSAR